VYPNVLKSIFLVNCVCIWIPTFDKQLENLKQYQGFGGDKYLPGTTEAADRFVRAAYYQKSLLRDVTTAREAVAGVISVARNVSQPFGTADPLSHRSSCKKD
jgi:penicillin V acylase-like amidase (Ntn superfamily)